MWHLLQTEKLHTPHFVICRSTRQQWVLQQTWRVSCHEVRRILKKDIPPLAVAEGEEVNMEDYTARRLAEHVMKHNTNLLRKGNAVNVGDATTGTWGEHY